MRSRTTNNSNKEGLKTLGLVMGGLFLGAVGVACFIGAIASLFFGYTLIVAPILGGLGFGLLTLAGACFKAAGKDSEQAEKEEKEQVVEQPDNSPLLRSSDSHCQRFLGQNAAISTHRQVTRSSLTSSSESKDEITPLNPRKKHSQTKHDWCGLKNLWHRITSTNSKSSEPELAPSSGLRNSK